MTLTFADTGVLIAAVRAGTATRQRALSLLADPNREWASSWFIRLELLPKALYFQRRAEIAFYRKFLQSVSQWVPTDASLVVAAYREATATGMAALDALHVVAAKRAGAVELVTTERPTKPIHRANGITVVTL